MYIHESIRVYTSTHMCIHVSMAHKLHLRIDTRLLHDHDLSSEVPASKMNKTSLDLSGAHPGAIPNTDTGMHSVVHVHSIV